MNQHNRITDYLPSGSPKPRLDWRQLLAKTESELEILDIVEVNEACAVGLPNADRIDVQECLEFVAACTAATWRMTERLFPKFRSSPGNFHDSEAFFRMTCLATVLQRDFGIHGSETFQEEYSPADSDGKFFHGLVRSRYGCCSNLPILYASVGRRLGYPLKLVQTAGHRFCRWDDPRGERINIECSCDGLRSPDDEYYVTEPRVLSPELVEAARWLKSLPPLEELAAFMINRSICLQEAGRYADAMEAGIAACLLSPLNRMFHFSCRQTLEAWRLRILALLPERFPQIKIRCPINRRFPPCIPMDIEERLNGIEVYQSLLDNEEDERNWWSHLRRNPCHWPWPAHVPKTIHIERVYHPDPTLVVRGASRD